MQQHMGAPPSKAPRPPTHLQRPAWQQHTGPLPVSVLLRGRLQRRLQLHSRMETWQPCSRREGWAGWHWLRCQGQCPACQPLQQPPRLACQKRLPCDCHSQLPTVPTCTGSPLQAQRPQVESALDFKAAPGSCADGCPASCLLNGQDGCKGKDWHSHQQSALDAAGIGRTSSSVAGLMHGTSEAASMRQQTTIAAYFGPQEQLEEESSPPLPRVVVTRGPHGEIHCQL